MEAIINFFKKVVERPWIAGIGALAVLLGLWLILEAAGVVNLVAFI